MPNGSKAIIYDENEHELDGEDPDLISNTNLDVSFDIMKQSLPKYPLEVELTQDFPSYHASRPYYIDFPKVCDFPPKTQFLKKEIKKKSGSDDEW